MALLRSTRRESSSSSRQQTFLWSEAILSFIFSESEEICLSPCVGLLCVPREGAAPEGGPCSAGDRAPHGHGCLCSRPRSTRGVGAFRHGVRGRNGFANLICYQHADTQHKKIRIIQTDRHNPNVLLILDYSKEVWGEKKKSLGYKRLVKAAKSQSMSVPTVSLLTLLIPKTSLLLPLFCAAALSQQTLILADPEELEHLQSELKIQRSVVRGLGRLTHKKEVTDSSSSYITLSLAMFPGRQSPGGKLGGGSSAGEMVRRGEQRPDGPATPSREPERHVGFNVLMSNRNLTVSRPNSRCVQFGVWELAGQ